MGLTLLDWIIVVVSMGFLIGVVRLSKRYMRSVADFLSAGRTAGRYMISMSQGMSALGSITIVGMWEMNYVAGFSLRWWEFTMGVVLLLITVSGWVLYRFRQTRALTMAQFFEIRYSRRFRIFAGVLAFLSGIVNFGIFPAVGARFFIYFCGLPLSFPVLGLEISTFPVVMIIFLSLAMYFVFAGGQIAVLITEFLQGVFANTVFLVLIVLLLFMVDWTHIFEALSSAPKDASLLNPVSHQQRQGFQPLVFPDRHGGSDLREDVVAGNAGVQLFGQERARGQDGRRAGELPRYSQMAHAGVRPDRRLYGDASSRFCGAGRRRERRLERPGHQCPQEPAHGPACAHNISSSRA